MDFLKNKFLIVPLLIFTAIFALDKIFMLDSVLPYTQAWNRIEPTFYKAREELFEILRKDYPKRAAKGEKLGLILGSSRAGDFNSKYIAKKVPGTFTYNFSAPFACPSFHYYWLEKILAAGMKPRFVMLEADPLVFSPQSVRYSLSFAYDLNFITRNIHLNRPNPRNPRDIGSVFRLPGKGFSLDEAETFMLKRLFAVYRYPPDPSAIIKNQIVIPQFNMNGNQFRRVALTKMAEGNRANLGGIPNPLQFDIPPEQLIKHVEAESRKFADSYLAAYRPAPTQVYFFKRMLRLLAERNIQTIVYWPLAPKIYRTAMEKPRPKFKDNLVEALKKPLRSHMDELKKEFPNWRAKLTDPQYEKSITCRLFMDPHHLAGKCYEQLTDHIFQDIK